MTRSWAAWASTWLLPGNCSAGSSGTTSGKADTPPAPSCGDDLVIAVFEPQDQDAVLTEWLKGFDDTVWQFIVMRWRGRRCLLLLAGGWAAWAAATCTYVPKLRSSKAVAVAAVATAGLWAVSMPLAFSMASRALRKKILKNANNDSDMLDITSNWVQHPHRCFWTAKIGGALVGAVAIGIGLEGMEHPEQAPKVYGEGAITGEDAAVYRMFTTAKARRRGVGSRALAAAEDFARGRGCRRTILGTANVDATKFYAKNGYGVYKELSFGGGGKAYVMEKWLKTPPAEKQVS